MPGMEFFETFLLAPEVHFVGGTRDEQEAEVWSQKSEGWRPAADAHCLLTTDDCLLTTDSRLRYNWRLDGLERALLS
jgi:hypothetical protein